MDLRSALLKANLITPEKYKKEEGRNSYGQLQVTGRKTKTGPETANTVNDFKREARILLETTPSALEDIITLAHKKFPDNKKLHAIFLSLKTEFQELRKRKRNMQSLSEYVPIIKKWLCKSTPKEWRANNKKGDIKQ